LRKAEKPKTQWEENSLVGTGFEVFENKTPAGNSEV
jgi:hypothetical protein